MDTFITLLLSLLQWGIIIGIILLIVKKNAKRSHKIIEKKNTSKRHADIENIDSYNEFVITFLWNRNSLNYMLSAQPIIEVNDGEEIHMMSHNQAILKFRKNDKFFFYVPYMWRKMYKRKEVLDLNPGNHYVIELKDNYWGLGRAKYTILNEKPLQNSNTLDEYDF